MYRLFSAAGFVFIAALAGASAQTAPAPAAPAPDAEGFVPLFNGKDLSGWVNVNCGPDTWTFSDGILHSLGKPTGALRTEKQYENFVLELEWRHLTSGGNAGIFIWASPLPATGQPFLRAIEVQVLDHGYGTSDWYTTHGDVFAIQGASMKPFPPGKGMRSFPTEQRSKPSPEWNHYRVTCQSGTIRLAVNGKEVSGGEQCDWHKGYLGLESEGAPVDWRNVRIKELPTSSPAPEFIGPAAPAQSRLLYNGRTLAGWHAAAGWTADDWQIAFTGKEAAPLVSESALDLPVLQFDLKLEAPMESLPVRIGKAAAFPVGLAAGWHRVKVSLGEKEIAWSVDGKPAGKTARTPSPDDRLALCPAVPCRFSSVFLLSE